MFKRKLQELYDKARDIQEQIKDLEIDLSKDKIVFVEISFDDWLYKTNEEEYWIYEGDSFRHMGVWEGLNEVSDEEREHFDEFKRDYFYYGSPNYIDRNEPNSEMTECELAFEGDCILQCIRRCDL